MGVPLYGDIPRAPSGWAQLGDPALSGGTLPCPGAKGERAEQQHLGKQEPSTGLGCDVFRENGAERGQKGNGGGKEGDVRKTDPVKG